MINSVRYERSNSSEQMQFNISSDISGDGSVGGIESPLTPSRTSITASNSSTEDPIGIGNTLCSHDGVLLKKSNAKHIADLNTSGSLSLVEYRPSKRLYIEWKPNENILIADDGQDQSDWALVDTISRRNRTASECKVFNAKPLETSNSCNKLRVIRTYLEDLSVIEVKQRRQTIKFIRKSDGTLHSEYFFQHGNADQFLGSLKNLHIIDLSSSIRGGEEYVILTNESQKLKKTFAELDIGEIKASSLGNEGWLPNRVVGLLASLPDYVTHKSAPKERPGTNESKERHKSTSSDNYQFVGMNGSINNSDSRSPSSSVDKSPEIYDLENVKEIDEKIIPALPERKPMIRGFPLNENQWLEFQTPDGRFSDSSRILKIIFKGGIEPKLRSEVWKYLLNYYQWDDTEVERIARRKQKAKEYYSMKAQWLSMTKIQETNFSGYRDRKCQIEKDVKRTDRSLDYFAGEDNPNLLTLQGILMTYVMYNFDLGYVQGMSDLLSPILAVMENEVDAFWCFVGFMDMVFVNFDIDQAGMKTQFNQLRNLLEFVNPRLFKYIIAHDSDNMYFCFRWLLVWYKREFSNDDILKLWECLWTKLPCPNYQILISVAILDQQTDIIIESQYEFNEILKHVNELSGNIDLKYTLEVAEAIYHQIKNAERLPNEIRLIIGEPLLEMDKRENNNSPEQSEDDFDELVKEESPEEKKRNQEWLEEACERSMFLQHI